VETHMLTSHRAGRWLLLLSAGLVLASCVVQSPPRGSGEPVTSQKKDGYPERALNVEHIPDAVPRAEPRTRAGNTNPYTVLGKTYHLVNDTTGFRQSGHASWYGTKFHGLRTANGEIYDMYGMTAAHKTLPIPSYVRVTNRDNGKSVVVRINDRGPFHDGRIIDLTYTAAKKLGFVEKGTAPVDIVYLDGGQAPAQVAGSTGAAQVLASAEPLAPPPVNSAGYVIPDNTFLQVGAFGSRTAAEALREQLEALTDHPVHLKSVALDNLVRVQIGPFNDNLELMNLRQKLIDAKFSEPHVVYE
jgi:rare lipoprotein A